MSRTSVGVVGAGVVGLTAGLALAEANADVTVYERGDVAAGATGRAAGVLYDAFADAANARLADVSQRRFRERSGEGAFAFTESPYVMLAREGDGERAGAIEAAVERMRANDRAVSLVDPDELGERFPIVTDDVAVAAVARGAGWGDPGDYARLLAERFVAAGGALRTETPVAVETGGPTVVPRGGSAERHDAVLVAAGAHAKRLLAGADVAVPLKPYRVQALTSATAYDGPMVYDATGGFYLRAHPTGLLAGDGTVPEEADPDGWDRAADEWFVAEMRERLAERLDCDLSVDRAWAGLCVATPDGEPLLGELPGHGGLYVAAGWQGHGVMRAPGAGEAVAEEILGGEGVPAFDPGRFEGDERFEIVEGMAVED
jgi:glycine/D-amino acid oxidase-like deaminating enzyme